MSQLKLYTSEICPYAQRTRIVMGEKGINHEVVEIDIADKPDWFVQLTPGQRVPVIDHDGFILWESATIDEYLDATFDNVALRSDDERGRAIMRNEIRYFDNIYLPQLYKLLFEQSLNQQAVVRHAVRREMQSLENRLREIQGETGPYWMGSEYGLADISMYPFFERLEVFEHYRGLTIPNDCPRLVRWLNAVRLRPAVAATAHTTEWYIPEYVAYANGQGSGVSAQAFRSGSAN
jgi:glutathione S-transferase